MLKDKNRSGRPPIENTAAILHSVENFPDLSLRKRAEAIGTSKNTIHRKLRSIGCSPKRGRWIPHELTNAHRQKRVDACEQLIARQRSSPFLSRLVTMDESWVHYDGRVRPIHWLRPGQVAKGTPKPNPLGKKVMLVVFWAKWGIIHWETLPQGIGLNSERFCAILDHVKVALQDASARGLLRRAPILQMDNAPCHRANATQSHIKDVLGWEQIVHPPYSPDLAPSDFHLFRSMKNHLRGVRFQNNADLENWLTNFFESKNGTNFYQRGIQKLQEKWRTVINNNGHYIFT